jgi:hypothetical protein
MQVLGKLSESTKITLVQIPERQEIPSNEETDRLTKEGATVVPPHQFTAVPFSVSKKTHEKAVGIEASGQVDCVY